MSMLRDLAKKATSSEERLTSGRERIPVDDIIRLYPKGVSIEGFDMLNSQDEEFPVFTFTEDETKFFSGGMAFHDMAKTWLESYSGDIPAINAELRAEPVKVKLEKVKTKNNRTFTKIIVL